jgi:CHAT domain-containing protein/Tfp pilus assembly protein PilF
MILATCLLFLAPNNADDQAKKLSNEERKELESKWRDLSEAGFKAYQSGKHLDGIKGLEAALEIAHQLYPKTDFPDGHENLAANLNNLATLYKEQGKHAVAEQFYREALDMRKRLFKGDHPDVASSLNNLAAFNHDLGKPAAAEPLYRESLDMRKRLFKGDHPAVAQSLNNLAALHKDMGKYAEAEPLYRESLDMRKRLFKGDHPAVAQSLNNLGFMLNNQGKYAEAELLCQNALDMRKRLFKGDHPSIATSMENLAAVYLHQGKFGAAEPLAHSALEMQKRLSLDDHPSVAYSLESLSSLLQHQGKYAEAEQYTRAVLDMRKRLYKGDHPSVARALDNLAFVYWNQGKYGEAEPLARAALEMRRRLFQEDHPDVAASLSSLAILYQGQQKYPEAEPLARAALDMHRRLFKGDHPNVAHSLSSLGSGCLHRGKYAEAEELYREALDMSKRQFKDDHSDIALIMNKLSVLYTVQGKYADAEPLARNSLDVCKRIYKDDHPHVAGYLFSWGVVCLEQGKHAKGEQLLRESLEMHQRLVRSFAIRKAEGEALTLIASYPVSRDAFLSAAWQTKTDPSAVYPALWASKGLVARIYEQRQLATRAAASNPKAAGLLAELASSRRQRAELLIAAEVNDPATRQKREDDLKQLGTSIARLDEALRPLLPAIERANKLNEALPSDLQKALPEDVAVVDFIRHSFLELDKEKLGQIGNKITARYSAFVVTKQRIAWADLGEAEAIEEAVSAWRECITGSKGIPDAIPTKVRALVWEKVRKELPAGIKNVYISPDATLCKLPWAALPGDKPETILLEDFAVAIIPHAQFLIDKLWPQDPLALLPTNALIVGGVKYDAELAVSAATKANGFRSEPLVKPEARVGWSFLPGAVGELNGIASIAARKKIAAIRLEGDEATSAAILATLPKAKYAHLATHGFFADASFRSAFRLDEKDYRKALWGERIGAAARNPLIMTGLVFAGANNPKTPGRGILTGESLIDLDLSGLQLAMLSACETGLGDVAGGEGTFGLQRAFHLAGTRNVVASLWKVPDQSTAALMALFYCNLWEKDLSPLESLRRAQLEIYRNPAKIGELANGFRGAFKEVPGMAEVEIKPNKSGKAHPLLWAAFTISGPGQ